jgi:hypothetical protein
MSKRKTKAPQFELPQAGAVFNLATQITTDGDRLAREAEAKQKARQQQDQQQPHLL